jgi:hypothetical protein
MSIYDQQPDFTSSGGLRGFQFSLASMFILTTAVAVILSILFSVGRWIGMSPGEILVQGLGQFLYYLPPLAVWVFGLMVAFRRLRRNRMPAILTIIALSRLILTAFIMQLTQMVLLHSLSARQLRHETLSLVFAGIGLVNACVHMACWILILMAIFRRRPPDASPVAPESSNPSQA